MNADALLGNRSRRRRAQRVSWLFMILAVLSLAAASCGGHPASRPKPSGEFSSENLATTWQRKRSLARRHRNMGACARPRR
jgi:hypothetical protein